MTGNRPTGPRAAPERTLLHRGLPAPLPRRPTWPGSVVIWFPVVLFTMIVLPVLIDVTYGDGSDDFPAPVPVTLALLAGLGVYVYELVALVRRRRRQR